MADEQSPCHPPEQPNPYYGDDVVVVQPAEPARPKQSGLGIASIIVGVLAVLAIVSGVLVVGVATRDMAMQGGAMRPEDMTTTAIVGSATFCGGSIFTIVGLGLGLAGCFQRDRGRTAAIIGATLNGVVVVGMLLLMLIGLVMQA